MTLEELHNQLMSYDPDWRWVNMDQLRTLVSELPIAILTIPRGSIERCFLYDSNWHWSTNFGDSYVDGRWKDPSEVSMILYWRSDIFGLFGEVYD